jgi:hypothetical protein
MLTSLQRFGHWTFPSYSSLPSQHAGSIVLKLAIGLDSAAVTLPQMPSLTRDDGMLAGICQRFAQWKTPFTQADVPEEDH